MVTGRALTRVDSETAKRWGIKATKENLKTVIMFMRDVVLYSVELYAVEMVRYYS